MLPCYHEGVLAVLAHVHHSIVLHASQALGDILIVRWSVEIDLEVGWNGRLQDGDMVEPCGWS